MRKWNSLALTIVCILVVSACAGNGATDSQGTDENLRDMPASQSSGSNTDDDLSGGDNTDLTEVPESEHSKGETQTEHSQPSTGLELADVKIASGIEEMVEQSSLVFIGVVDGPEEIINTARDVNDISQPDPNLVILGQVYRVEVEQYIQGDGPDAQNVVQSEGFIHHGGEQVNIPTDQSVIKREKDRYGAVPIQSGERYLFFANPLRGFDPDEHYVVGDAGYPTRFLLGDDGLARQESPIEGLDEQFPPRSVDELLADVEALVSQR